MTGQIGESGEPLTAEAFWSRLERLREGYTWVTDLARRKNNLDHVLKVVLKDLAYNSDSYELPEANTELSTLIERRGELDTQLDYFNVAMPLMRERANEELIKRLCGYPKGPARLGITAVNGQDYAISRLSPTGAAMSMGGDMPTEVEGSFDGLSGTSRFLIYTGSGEHYAISPFVALDNARAIEVEINYPTSAV